MGQENARKMMKKTCEVEKTVESLPNEVMVMILNKLPFEDMKNARLVCKKWDKLVTSKIPMSVTVDDKLEGNVEFIKKIVKTRVAAVRIREISTIHALLKPQRVNLLTKLEINGVIHPNFLCCVVPRMMNLDTLILRGKTFLRNLSFDQKFVLKNLRSLKIYSPYKPNGNRNPDDPFLGRNAELLFGENLRGLLSTLSCPLLETFVIDGDLDQIRLPSGVDWKNGVLRKFLKTHSKTLKHVLIGESSILKLRVSRRNQDLQFPQYKSLHVSFHGKALVRYNPRVLPEKLDWCQLINKQKHLEYLNLGVLWYPFLSNMLRKLPPTLKYLSIYWNTSTFSTLDANIFTELPNLEQLELTHDGAGHEVLLNFFGLASCRKLKSLVLEQVMIPRQFIEAIPHLFPYLEMLYLFRCTNEGDDDDQHAPEEFGITHEGLSGLINIRTLEYLFVSARDFLGPELVKKEMASWFSGCSRYDSVTKGYHIGVEPNFSDAFST